MRPPRGRLLVSPGAKQGLFYALSAILEDGDEVIIPEPVWVSFGDIVKLAGGKPVFVSGRESAGFLPALSDMRAKITPKTKAILINNPVNPTGAFYDGAYVTELQEMCREKNLYLVSDEIYSDILYGPRKFCSAAAAGNPKTIVVSGFSKMAAMTGWRLGYIVAGPAVIDRCLKVQQQTASCPSSIAQAAGIAALRHFDSYFPSMLKKYRQRRDLLVAGIPKLKPLRCFIPSGAFYVWVDIRGLKIDSAAAVEWLLEKAGVAVMPGSAYGPGGEGYVRLSFAADEKVLKEALEKIRKSLAR